MIAWLVCQKRGRYLAVAVFLCEKFFCGLLVTEEIGENIDVRLYYHWNRGVGAAGEGNVAAHSVVSYLAE